MTIVPNNSQTEVYQKFTQFLQEKHPLKESDKIELRLENYKYIPYRVNGELKKAFAVVNNIRNTDKLVIRLAVGNNKQSLKSRLDSIAHEYCHGIQYFRGEVFDTDWDAKLELEAMNFAKKVVDEYFKI